MLAINTDGAPVQALLTAVALYRRSGTRHSLDLIVAPTHAPQLDSIMAELRLGHIARVVREDHCDTANYLAVLSLDGDTVSKDLDAWRQLLARLSDDHPGPPTISAIIPAHNEELWITRSLTSLLDQDYQDLEIIVVADDCTDRTVEAVTELGIEPRIISARSLGTARNHGVSAATGDYCLFLDADDYLITPTAVTRITTALAESNYPDILHFDFYWGRGQRYRPMPVVTLQGQVRGNVVPMSWCRCWKTSLLRRFPFSTGLHEDDDLIQRVASKSDLREETLNEALYLYEYPRTGSLMANTYGKKDADWRPPIYEGNRC